MCVCMCVKRVTGSCTQSIPSPHYLSLLLPFSHFASIFPHNKSLTLAALFFSTTASSFPFPPDHPSVPIPFMGKTFCLRGTLLNAQSANRAQYLSSGETRYRTTATSIPWIVFLSVRTPKSALGLKWPWAQPQFS